MPPTPLEEAIVASRMDDHLRALTLFIDIYGTEDSPPIRTPKDASGLSFFGLALALMQKKFKPAIDLCRRAIDLEFYNGDHYANLARVYVAAGNRKKAVETASKTLRDLRIAEVVKMDMKVENGKVLAYRTRVLLSFKYES